MGVRIIEDKDTDMAVLYCSTSLWAFGPIFAGRDEAQEFLDWLESDPRRLSDRELDAKCGEFFRWKSEMQINDDPDAAGVVRPSIS
jgi:hypothetical protein